VLEESEKVVARYVSLMALINAGQALLVTAVMSALGMPEPILWGVFTFVLEFVPYLGATVMISLLAVMGLVTFDSIGQALLPPASYFLIATLQTSVVSPIAYGRRLSLHPVTILVGVLFWWFVWGVAGAFVAVPILAVIKIVADRSEALAPLGKLMGE